MCDRWHSSVNVPESLVGTVQLLQLKGIAHCLHKLPIQPISPPPRVEEGAR